MTFDGLHMGIFEGSIRYIIYPRSRLIEHYKTEREGADRIENLAELVNAAAAFTEEERETESGETADPLTAFLTHAALEAGRLRVLLDDFATQDAKAKFPLREAEIEVTEDAARPGAYRAVARLRPHFQLDEITVSLRLVARLPQLKS